MKTTTNLANETYNQAESENYVVRLHVNKSTSMLTTWIAHWQQQSGFQVSVVKQKQKHYSNQSQVKQKTNEPIRNWSTCM